ncbi:MAG: glucose-6-phosphate dehydrogenase [Deltaproteobacteria bacterium]|nr:MAG: glucose-6-phosphate dehydrogenase [Deltaproteobacteria bacterium]
MADVRAEAASATGSSLVRMVTLIAGCYADPKRGAMCDRAAMSKPTPEPSLFIIFGGTGDLARRKLLPALARLAHEDQLGNCHVVGVTRETHYDDESYRAFVSDALDAAGLTEDQRGALCASRLHFQTIGPGTEADFKALGVRLAALEERHGLAQNRTFYLSLPPKAFQGTMEGLANVGLDESNGWTRLVVEKPFGRDLATAQELNAITHRCFREEQVYRIDHYLGKETVQNLLVFRFANTIFESMWNRERVESVMITVSESLGLGTRSGYYDGIGALRDMVQNHLTQLLTLVAMEPPSSFDAEAIRYEKIKVLKSMAPIDPSKVVRGQYDHGTIDGEKVPGYLEEEGVPMTSSTETFVAMQLEIDNWRWKGVPFYLRSGKRLAAKSSQIAVRFRDVPVSLFRSMGAKLDTTDVLIITLQPDEGFSMHLDVKAPGEPFRTKQIPLEFRYADRFEEIPPAYQTLLLNVLHGDQTLFVHADEVERSWHLYTPLLENPPIIHRYRAGSWGPKEAGHLGIPETDLWQVDGQ